jgi:bifunctional DNA-binding transcriptional regulator/antitoxin component of YhaV-PrlF toxin-antitoxin module
VTIIGTAKITHGNKIALITDVRKKLDTDIGDVIVFEENAKGQIVIKKG